MNKVHEVPFSEAFISVPVGKQKLQQSQYLPKGKYRIVDQGKSEIFRFSNDDHLVRTGGPFVVFGDHTKEVKYVDYPFVVGADGVRLYKANDDFRPRYLYYFLKSISLPSDSYGRHSKYLHEVAVPKIGKSHQEDIENRISHQLIEIEKAREAVEVQLREVKQLKDIVRHQAFKDILSKSCQSYMLKDICRISAGGTPSRGNASFFNGSLPWVKTLDLNFGSVMDTQEKISQEAFEAIRGEMLPVGTVLVAMYGGAGTIGKSGILGIEACTNQAVCALKPDSTILSSEFLHEWLCYIRPEWMQFSSGNRKDPNINKSIVEKMTIPLPSLKEQILFVQFISEGLSQMKIMEESIIGQLEEVKALPQKILAQAFEKTSK